MRRSSIGSDPKDKTVSSSMSIVRTVSGRGDSALGGDEAGASSDPCVGDDSGTSGMLAKTSNDGDEDDCAELSDSVGLGDRGWSSSGMSSKPGFGSEVSTAL